MKKKKGKLLFLSLYEPQYPVPHPSQLEVTLRCREQALVRLNMEDPMVFQS